LSVGVAGPLPFRTATNLLEKTLRKRHRTSHDKTQTTGHRHTQSAGRDRNPNDGTV
jgi:hypothetical protein